MDIRQHPVLLLPDAPAEGLYIPDLLRSRYGVTDPKASFARPEAEARASGLDLDLSRQPWTYRTQAAHGLILAARARGTQHQLAVAITDAHFLEAKNIADADVLADIAVAYGFERKEARAIAGGGPIDSGRCQFSPSLRLRRAHRHQRRTQRRRDCIGHP